MTPCATADATLDVIGTHPAGIAILDINLGDPNSFPVADRLAELGIPFLFATGYGERALLPDWHRGRSVVQRPYTIENLARALAELIGLDTAST